MHLVTISSYIQEDHASDYQQQYFYTDSIELSANCLVIHFKHHAERTITFSKGVRYVRWQRKTILSDYGKQNCVQFVISCSKNQAFSFQRNGTVRKWKVIECSVKCLNKKRISCICTPSVQKFHAQICRCNRRDQSKCFLLNYYGLEVNIQLLGNLWGSMETSLYSRPVDLEMDLAARIVAASATNQEASHIIHKTWDPLLRCLYLCNGSHFQHLLWTVLLNILKTYFHNKLMQN